MGTVVIAFFVIVVLTAILDSGSKSTNGGSTSSSTTATTSAPPDPKQLALSETTLTYRWHKDGFGSVMIADFVIKNNSDYSFKDFEIKCSHFAKSGTLIDSNDRTIYDVVAAHSTKKLPEFNMGLINSQAATTSCEIVDLTVTP